VISTVPALAALQDVAAQPAAVARQWRARGGRVCATIGASVPHELIDAAGVLPVRLPLATETAAAAARRFAGTGLGPVGAGHLAALIDGAHGPLDALVIGRDSTDHAKLFGVLRELRRTATAPDLPPVAFLDAAQLGGRAGATYDRVKREELRNHLVAWFGAPVTDGDLERATAGARRRQRRLRDVNALRHRFPARLTGVEARAVIAAGHVLPGPRYLALLDDLLANAHQLVPHDGARVLLAGSRSQDTAVVALIEAQGLVVVGEEHDGVTVDTGTDRLVSDGAVRSRAAAIVEAAGHVLADLVVVLVADHDAGTAWEAPTFLGALSVTGRPALRVDDDLALDDRARWMDQLRSLAMAKGPS
jgi:benzoyl-CoA reductase/2-hydroxyglutaryl-CoA dehydratase subunit BcrC/BadD/HgdB